MRNVATQAENVFAQAYLGFFLAFSMIKTGDIWSLTWKSVCPAVQFVETTYALPIR